VHLYVSLDVSASWVCAIVLMIELFPEPVLPNMTMFLSHGRICYIQSASALCGNAPQEVEHLLCGCLHLEVGVRV
jgi:hypothetical protein